MADEIVVRSGKTLRVGDVSWTIVDEGKAPLTCPDFLVDTRNINGNLHLAFGSTRAEGGVPEVLICTRMRIDIVFAQMLRQTLDNLISEAVKPQEKGKAN